MKLATQIILLMLLSYIASLPSAFACRGPQAETFIFYNQHPKGTSDTDFIGKVQVLGFKRGMGPPFRIKVITSETHSKLVGKVIEMNFRLTSCGPYLSPQNRFGDGTGKSSLVTEGFVIGEFQGNTLSPFSHRMGSEKPRKGLSY